MCRLIPAILLLATTGCLGASSDPGHADVWGNSVRVPLLEPYQGKWRYDHDRTIAAWEAAGVPAAQIENARKLNAREAPGFPPEAEKALRAAGRDPEEILASMRSYHPDIVVDGHVVTCSGLPQAEYRLFGLHEHDGQVCGKAWHHEDRHDPGDMSKCYVKLKLAGDELHFHFRMQESLPDASDSDLVGSPALVLDSSQGCDADRPPGSDWSEWTICVFVRQSQAK